MQRPDQATGGEQETKDVDRRTMVVGIRHPGGDRPDRGALPRLAVIAAKPADNGITGGCGGAA